MFIYNWNNTDFDTTKNSQKTKKIANEYKNYSASSKNEEM